MLVAPAREVIGKVESNSSTFNPTDNLVSFIIDRTGEQGKFFGFGICQKLSVQLLDKDRAINLLKGEELNASIGVGTEFIKPSSPFYIDEIVRDETTNQISIVAYDALYKANTTKISEITLPSSYTINELAGLIFPYLGLSGLILDNSIDTIFETAITGDETIREVLNDIAEVTQSIYYINNENWLVFKRLGSTVDLIIDKTQYFTLNNKTEKTLTMLIADKIQSGTEDGETQYINNNIFYNENEDNKAVYLDAAIQSIGVLSINQFELNWRGNPLLEIGDRIQYQIKDDSYVHSYILNDIITYDGGLSEYSSWAYGEETSANISIKDAISNTNLIVDKANKRIEAVVAETTANSESIANIVIDIEAIGSSVSKIETNVQTEIDGVNEVIDVLENRVDTLVTPEGLDIAITERLQQGVDSVTTTTGYTFGADGLTVSKSDSDISTQITEDGMTVTRGEHTVLTANNEGVVAEDLHATTYLIIGGTTRFEDFTWNGMQRCGAFWIGG